MLTDEDVRWVVNSLGELGVKIGEQFFWLYKGRSLVYTDNDDPHDPPILWRPVDKREFGETCQPVDLQRLDVYTREVVGGGEEYAWRPLPLVPYEAPAPDDEPKEP